MVLASSTLEPALEFYAGQDEKALGPVLLGQIKLGVQKQLKWETGALLGLDSDTSDVTFRLMLEYAFYYVCRMR